MSFTNHASTVISLYKYSRTDLTKPGLTVDQTRTKPKFSRMNFRSHLFFSIGLNIRMGDRMRTLGSLGGSSTTVAHVTEYRMNEKLSIVMHFS